MSINDIIDQLDNVALADSCCSCFCPNQNLFSLSCHHKLCKECAERACIDGQGSICPSCRSELTVTLDKLLNKSKSDLDPIAATYSIDFSIPQYCYSGQHGNWWLYSMNINGEINACQEDTCDITINGGTYVIDLEKLIQHPEGQPQKKRYLKVCNIKTKKDLAKYKIVGIAGRLFI
jgi:hypothetical protein